MTGEKRISRKTDTYDSSFKGQRQFLTNSTNDYDDGQRKTKRAARTSL